METKQALTLGMPARYRLRLQGQVSVGWADWFDEVSISFIGKSPVTMTVVTGILRDQSALFGLVSYIRDLGVPLISIEAIQWPVAAPRTISERRFTMKKNLIRLICNALAMALGVAVVVLNILGNLTTGTAFSLLGIGLAALGFAGLEKE